MNGDTRDITLDPLRWSLILTWAPGSKAAPRWAAEPAGQEARTARTLPTLCPPESRVGSLCLPETDN